MSAPMTESEWQNFYEITSVKGRIWKRSEVAKRAVEMLKVLSPGILAPVGRVAVLFVLDDPAFMRPRRGMVPARVAEDAAIEAMLLVQRGVTS